LSFTIKFGYNLLSFSLPSYPSSSTHSSLSSYLHTRLLSYSGIIIKLFGIAWGEDWDAKINKHKWVRGERLKYKWVYILATIKCKAKLFKSAWIVIELMFSIDNDLQNPANLFEMISLLLPRCSFFLFWLLVYQWVRMIKCIWLNA